MKIGRLIFGLCLIWISCLFLPAPVIIAEQTEQAQEQSQEETTTQTQTEAQAAEEAEAQVDEKMLTEELQAPETRLSLYMAGVDIKELFKILSQKSSFTITTTDKVQGRIDVSFDNLTLKEILDDLAIKHNLVYGIKDKTIKVMTAEEYAQLSVDKQEETQADEVSAVAQQSEVKPHEGTVTQTQPETQIAEETPAITQVEELTPAVTQAQPEIEVSAKLPEAEELISLDLQGVDINELFKLLSLKTGLTIITTPDVQGRVTVFLNNLTFEDALDVIVTKANLTYERKDNKVIVMTAQEYEQTYGKKFGERQKVKTIKLKYAKPSSIFTLISPLKSSIGQIIADDESGTILIIEAPQTLSLIEGAIRELDQPLQTAVFDINYANSRDIKTYLNELITPGLGKVITDERSSKVIVTDLPQRLAKIKNLVSELDEESRQVLITGEIIEIALSDKYYRGIDWEKVFSQRLQDNLDLSGEFGLSLTNYQQISVGTLATNNYNVVLKILEEYGDTKTLSRPRVVVVNKEEAQVLVGTREAYVTSTLSQAEATTVTAEQVEFIDVGVKLNVVPTIGKDGFITMKIKPEVSTVSETLTTSEGSTIPIVSTSESETVVKVKDGATVMIAGLLKEEHSETIKGIPVLSKIPIIGAIFGSRQTEKPDKTELVIFLTPQIITGEGHLVREVEDEKN